MTEERIIISIEVSRGGESDCKQFPILLKKSQNNGVEIKEVIGDMAYVSKDNLDISEENGMTLFAKTNFAMAAAAASAPDEGFSFNKDTGLLQCPAGKLAMRLEKRLQRMGTSI